MTTQRVNTFCRVCEPACGLVAEVEGGELRSLRPDREHPVSRGFACNKGLAGAQIHADPDRLNHPQRRAAGGGFERVSWDEAIGSIAAKLAELRERHGPDAIASYIGNPAAFNALLQPAAGALFGQLGVRRSFSSGTQDCANKFAGSEAVFGSSTIHPIPDFEHTQVLLSFGANPRVSHASFMSVADPMRKLKDAIARGAKVYHFNPRRIETVDSGGGAWVPTRPDTDLYVLAALLAAIDEVGGFDPTVIEQHGSHVEELRAFVHRYPPERVAAVTGIPAAELRRIAAEFAAADGASVHVSTGVNMGRQGTLAYWLVHMLSFVTGNLDRVGGNILSVGFYKAAKAGRRRFDEGYVESPFGTLRKGALPGNLLSHYILDVESPVRALIVLAGNPLLSIGGEERLRQALPELELLVVIDLYANATAEYAHYLLPATDQFEREDINITGLGMQHEPYLQFTERVVAPRFERKEEWWILARLCQELGLKSALDAGDAPNLWGRIDHMVRSTRGISLDEVRAQPHGIVFGPLQPARFYEEQLQTDDGRVECCPPAFAEALDTAEQIFRELEGEGDRGLKLITRRDPYMHNSWYANVPGMKRGKRDRNYLFVHPDDAAKRGFEEGERVRISNDWGSLEVELALDDTLMPGVVALTHGWGHERVPGMQFARSTPGVNANRLLPIGPGSFERLSNQAHMTGVPVELKRAESSAA